MRTKRVTRRFSTLDDLKEGVSGLGPVPRGWVERFWEKVDKRWPDECWEWIASCGGGGYGQLAIHSVPYLVHRLSFLLANGGIDPDLLVMHSCDNPKCVNPAHLSQGTYLDNRHDQISKGRSPVGMQNGKSKLSESAVLEIRRRAKSGEPPRSIAGDYLVGLSCIYKIIRNVSWSWL